jgi:hypothetical protein
MTTTATAPAATGTKDHVADPVADGTEAGPEDHLADPVGGPQDHDEADDRDRLLPA